jgi:trimethylamine--corrinoid protein Co-methyltransferase
LNLPLRCAGSFTTSKLPDGQAMQESVMSMLSAIHCGANFILHAAGFLDGLLSMSYEKFMMDADFCGALHSYVNGVTVDENTLAMSAFQGVTPGGHYLGSAHTMANYTTAFFDSSISDDTPFETWAEAGQSDAATRANKRWKQSLAEYVAPPMDEAVDEALRDFIDRTKASMPDQWY